MCLLIKNTIRVIFSRNVDWIFQFCQISFDQSNNDIPALLSSALTTNPDLKKSANLIGQNLTERAPIGRKWSRDSARPFKCCGGFSLQCQQESHRRFEKRREKYLENYHSTEKPILADSFMCILSVTKASVVFGGEFVEI